MLFLPLCTWFDKNENGRTLDWTGCERDSAFQFRGSAEVRISGRVKKFLGVPILGNFSPLLQSMHDAKAPIFLPLAQRARTRLSCLLAWKRINLRANFD